MNDMRRVIENTVSDKDLEKLLKEAAKREMTPEERFEQKVSFVYGQLMDCNPNITKDEVRQRLLKFKA